MRFPSPLVRGRLVQRYKRFLADVRLDSGETITAACPNTGAMLGLNTPGVAVWLSRSEAAKRKVDVERCAAGCWRNHLLYELALTDDG